MSRRERRYTCSLGHTIESSLPLAACPAAIDGVPCPGELTERLNGRVHAFDEEER